MKGDEQSVLSVMTTLPCSISTHGLEQEIYRPGTTISDASNLCTAVGGDQNKEFRGNASILREKGPRAGIRIYCFFLFNFDQKAKNHKYSLL